MAPSASLSASGSGCSSSLRPGQELAHGAVLAAVPGEPDVQAQVPVAVPARAAGPVRDGRVDGHPLALLWPVGDDAGRLVAQHQGAAQGRVADAALAPPVQVGSADADRGDPDQAVTRAGDRDRFLSEPKVTYRMQPCRSHPSPRGLVRR